MKKKNPRNVNCSTFPCQISTMINCTAVREAYTSWYYVAPFRTSPFKPLEHTAILPEKHFCFVCIYMYRLVGVIVCTFVYSLYTFYTSINLYL